MSVGQKEQVLIVEPAEELVFKGPFNKSDVVTSTIFLKNPTDEYVIYRMQISKSHVKNYMVCPNGGLLGPQEDCTITVTAMSYSGVSFGVRDWCNVKTMIVSPNFRMETFDDVWKGAPSYQFMSSELLCVFLDKPIDELSSTSAMASESSPPESSTESSKTGTENKKHREACEKVISEKATVGIRPVRFNHIGIPRSGKTFFQRRMAGDISNILEAIKRGEKLVQPSTGVAEEGGQIIVGNMHADTKLGTISSKVWSTLKGPGEEATMLEQLFYQFVSISSGLPVEDEASDTPDLAASITSEASASITSEASADESLNSSSFTPETLPEVASKLSDSEEKMLAVIEEAMNSDEWDKATYLLDDLILLINTDTGGQVEFLEMQGSIVHGPSFNLLYSRLIDDLDHPFKAYYTNKEGVSTEEEDSTLTVQELLFQTLSSIACFGNSFLDTAPSLKESGIASPGKQGGKDQLGYSKSKVMFVGTYRDKVTDEEFKKKDLLLQQKIRSTDFLEKGIVEFASKDQLMFAVNNMSGGEDEIKKIQGVLEKVITKCFKKIDIPASWLVLSLYIRRKKLRTISLEECEKIAGMLKIDPEELQIALWFLHHCVGVLLYYPELQSLKDTVICELQVLYDSTTNLVKNTFTFDKVGQIISEQFRENAQFTLKDVLEAMSDLTDDLLPPEKLIELLDHINILTALPNEGDGAEERNFFMPSVLKSARTRDLGAPTTDSDPAPLMLQYDCGYMPIGLFPSMIANLISQTLDGWEMINEGLYKNRIQFHVGEDCDLVTLNSHPQHLEVIITRRQNFETPNEDLCASVRTVIQSTLKTVTQHMNYDFCMGYKFGFECPLHPGKAHLCMLSHDATNEAANKSARCMKCLENPRRKKIVNLEEKHKVWFSEECFFASASSFLEKSTPAIRLSLLNILKWKDSHGSKQIFHLVNHVSAKWKTTAIQLQFTFNQVEGWDQQYRGNANNCWNNVMDHWLNPCLEQTCDYKASWEGLYSLLDDMEYSEVTLRLKEAVAGYSPHI